MKKWILFLFLCACNKPKLHPEKGPIVEAVYGLGTVESEKIFHAKAAIISNVKDFFVTEGEDVKKGQKLFIIDQDTVTVAPFDGRVTDIDASIGENLFPQSQILTVVDLKKMYLAVSLEQQATMRLKPGIKSEVSFEFFRKNKLIGTVSSIYPSKDQFIAKVQIPDFPSGVLPGMTADVAFKIDAKENATLVPVKAISNGHLLIKRLGKKMKLSVKVGLMDMEKAEIISPKLESEDEIILP